MEVAVNLEIFFVGAVCEVDGVNVFLDAVEHSGEEHSVVVDVDESVNLQGSSLSE